MEPLNLPTPVLILKWKALPEGHPRCMQCGKPSTTDAIRDGVTTTWCDFHAPTIYAMGYRKMKKWQRKEVERLYG